MGSRIAIVVLLGSLWLGCKDKPEGYGSTYSATVPGGLAVAAVSELPESLRNDVKGGGVVFWSTEGDAKQARSMVVVTPLRGDQKVPQTTDECQAWADRISGGMKGKIDRSERRQVGTNQHWICEGRISIGGGDAVMFGVVGLGAGYYVFCPLMKDSPPFESTCRTMLEGIRLL